MVRVRAHVLGGVVEARAACLALGPGLSGEADGDAAARAGAGEVRAGRRVPEATDRGAGDREAVAHTSVRVMYRYRVMYRVLKTSLIHCTHHDNAIYTHARHTLTLSHLHTRTPYVTPLPQPLASAALQPTGIARPCRPVLSPSPIIA